jgi:DNA-binding transcriptional regulator YdaS (Cro superfamily)
MKTTEIKKLAGKVGRHPTTVFRWLNRTRKISPEDARLLEKATGIPRLSWLYPDEYNNPMMRRDNERSA